MNHRWLAGGGTRWVAFISLREPGRADRGPCTPSLLSVRRQAARLPSRKSSLGVSSRNTSRAARAIEPHDPQGHVIDGGHQASHDSCPGTRKRDIIVAGLI